MMKQIFRYFLLLSLFSLGIVSAVAQEQMIKKRHEVKRKETIFGIAREYGVTIQELINANPEMNKPGYELKKGDIVLIPYATGTEPQPKQQKTMVVSTLQPAKKVEQDMRQRSLRIGVMLPLHDVNGDGKRMVEYYRGVLMACDSLRAEGISTDIRAWNVAEGADIRVTLLDEHAADRDLIIGPLYSKQVKALGDFAKIHGISVLIPFSINSTEIPSSIRFTRTARPSMRLLSIASISVSRNLIPSSSTATTRRVPKALSPQPFAVSLSKRG